MSLPPKALKVNPDGVCLSCRVQPGASRTQIVGPYGEDAVKIALQAPPVDGKANLELCRFLAQICQLKNSEVSILSGHTNRSKIVQLKHITLDQIIKLLK